MVRKVLTVGVLVTCVGVLAPPPVNASRVFRSTDQPDAGSDGFLEARLHYRARPGESNRLRVDEAPEDNGILLTDSGVDKIDIVTPSCEQVSAQQVLCRENRDGFLDTLDIGLRDGRDRALVISTETQGQTFSVDLHGGRGADVLASREPFTTFYAGSGDDIVRASNGDPDYRNFVDCGPGRDRVTLFSGRYRVARDCEHVTRFN